MDRAVLAAYGWADVPTECAFLLDYEDEEEDDEGGKRKKTSANAWSTSSASTSPAPSRGAVGSWGRTRLKPAESSFRSRRGFRARGSAPAAGHGAGIDLCERDLHGDRQRLARPLALGPRRRGPVTRHASSNDSARLGGPRVARPDRPRRRAPRRRLRIEHVGHVGHVGRVRAARRRVLERRGLLRGHRELQRLWILPHVDGGRAVQRRLCLRVRERARGALVHRRRLRELPRERRRHVRLLVPGRRLQRPVGLLHGHLHLGHLHLHAERHGVRRGPGLLHERDDAVLRPRAVLHQPRRRLHHGRGVLLGLVRLDERRLRARRPGGGMHVRRPVRERPVCRGRVYVPRRGGYLLGARRVLRAELRGGSVRVRCRADDVRARQRLLLGIVRGRGVYLRPAGDHVRHER